MACDRSSAALTAHALGARLEPPAAAHLAICSRCQAWLAKEQSLARMLDGAIDAIGSVEPGADFRVRLAERLAVQPVATRGWWPLAVGVASVAALVVMAFAIWWRPPPTPGAREPQAAADQDRADAVVPEPDPDRVRAGAGLRPDSGGVGAGLRPAPVAEPAGVASVSVPSAPRTLPRRAMAVASATPEAFEVLVPPGQRESFVRLVARLSREDPAIASRLLGPAGEVPPPPAMDVSERVAIQPLVVPDLSIAKPILEN